MNSVSPQTAAIRRVNQEYVNIIHTCKLEIALNKQTRSYNGTLLIHYSMENNNYYFLQCQFKASPRSVVVCMGLQMYVI